MKAWRAHAFGEPESMRLDEIPQPTPGKGQVLIRNRAIGLNFFDLLQLQGKYQVKPPFPFTPGAEVAGTVAAVDPDSRAFPVGEPVVAITYNNAFAEYSVADAKSVFPIPAGMSFAEGAALPIVYCTSWFALDNRAHLRKGETMLVHAGASGVGMSAIQIGKAMGARVLATAGSAEKIEFCREQGAEHAFDYRDIGWVERVKEITFGAGADVIYDPVGGDVFELSLKCIAPEGRLLVIGFASGRIPNVAANRVLLKNAAVVGAMWGNYAAGHPDYVAQTFDELARLFTAGEIKPAATARFPFEQAPAGLRALASRSVMGKAVLILE